LLVRGLSSARHGPQWFRFLVWIVPDRLNPRSRANCGVRKVVAGLSELLPKSASFEREFLIRADGDFAALSRGHQCIGFRSIFQGEAMGNDFSGVQVPSDE